MPTHTNTHSFTRATSANTQSTLLNCLGRMYTPSPVAATAGVDNSPHTVHVQRVDTEVVGGHPQRVEHLLQRQHATIAHAHLGMPHSLRIQRTVAVTTAAHKIQRHATSHYFVAEHNGCIFCGDINGPKHDMVDRRFKVSHQESALFFFYSFFCAFQRIKIGAARFEKSAPHVSRAPLPCQCI